MTDVLLAAARECVLAVGVRRTTLTDVARRAGVSRMTVYRRYPDVRSLVADAMTSEFGELLAAHISRSGHSSSRERLVDQTVAAIRALRANALLRKVIDVDPELLLPYVTDRMGETQRRAEEFFAAGLRQGHDDGSVRKADPTAQARTLLLVTQSYVLSFGPVSDGVEADSLYAELRELLDGYLTPDRQ